MRSAPPVGPAVPEHSRSDSQRVTAVGRGSCIFPWEPQLFGRSVLKWGSFFTGDKGGTKVFSVCVESGWFGEAIAGAPERFSFLFFLSTVKDLYL